MGRKFRHNALLVLLNEEWNQFSSYVFLVKLTAFTSAHQIQLDSTVYFTRHVARSLEGDSLSQTSISYPLLLLSAIQPAASKAIAGDTPVNPKTIILTN